MKGPKSMEKQQVPFAAALGLTNSAKRQNHRVPTTNVQLNKYGNLIGGQGHIKRLLNHRVTF